MSGTQSKAPQLEARHHEITEDIVTTVNQTTMMEAEQDTPLFRQRLQKVLGSNSSRSYQKGQEPQTTHEFCKKSRLGSNKIRLRTILF